MGLDDRPTQACILHSTSKWSYGLYSENEYKEEMGQSRTPHTVKGKRKHETKESMYEGGELPLPLPASQNF
jgi:hypothetical protein